MAGKRPVKKKASKKKPAKKKTAGKKAPPGNAVKKKAAAKKPGAKRPVKKSSRAAAAKAPRQHKPRLGFDPLSHEDIAALTTPGLPGSSAGLEDTHHGLDALIRDTTMDAPLAPPRPETVAKEQAPPPEPLREEEPEAAAPPPVEPMGTVAGDLPETVEPAPSHPAAPVVPEPQAVTEQEAPEVPDVIEEKAKPFADEAPGPLAGTAPEGGVLIGLEDAEEDRLYSAKEQQPAPKEKPSENREQVVEKARERAGKADDDEQGDVSGFFSFRLGKESFAIEIDRVKEVLEYQKPTKVPRMPSHMKGVINLRGGVVPVVDLRLLFGMKASELTVNSAIIIVEVGEGEEQGIIGAQVDSVREVLSIRDSDIAPPPRIGTGLNTDFIQGMGKITSRHGEEFVMILGVDNVFSVERLLGK